MNVVKIKHTGEYFLLNICNEIKNGAITYFSKEIKNGILTYFKYGEGYKKTKAFNIINDDELLELFDKNINELYVAKITSKYGVNVGSEYANRLVAGIIANQTAKGLCYIYEKIKDILPENFNNDFFKLLKCEYLFSCYGIYELDIIQLDKTLSKLDPNYDNEDCTYNNNICSMNEYITLKFGEPYSNIIKRLCEESNKYYEIENSDVDIC